METYNNFISQFEIFDNPPGKAGFHRHHIVPKCIQKKLYGEVIDERQVYLKYSEHAYAHWLYDKENNTYTVSQFRGRLDKNINDVTCYDDFICLDKNPWQSEETKQLISLHHRDVSGQNNPCYGRDQSGINNPMYGRTGEKHPFYGKHHTEEAKKANAERHKGKKSSEETKKKQSEANKGKHLYNNGQITVLRYECPEGFVPGRLKKLI